MANNHNSFCNEWIEKATRPREDFSSSEYLAFEAHLALCPSCSLARRDFQMISQLLRTFPAHERAVSLPTRLVQFWEREGKKKE